MAPIDLLLWQRHVMHRAEAARECSRATLSRRVASGWWWRPSSRTVARNGVRVDEAFAFETALAHSWPSGALTGDALTYLTGRSSHFPDPIELSVARRFRGGWSDGFMQHRYEDQDPQLIKYQGRALVVDHGPSSVVHSSLAMLPEVASWLLIDVIGSGRVRNKKALSARGNRYYAAVTRIDRQGSADVAQRIQATIAGCQSPGEIEVWREFRGQGVLARAQKLWIVPVADREEVGTTSIYSDFWLPEQQLVVEVDSRLHDHLADVRRDAWLLRRGIRTVRIVGRDFFTNPERAKATLWAGIA